MFLHTMLRVTNLEESIKFYTENFKLKINKKTDYPEGKFTLAFLGYGDIATHSQIELTYNWDVDSYQIGTAFGHLAFAVKDIYAFCNNLKANGVKITREPGAMKHGTTVIAFVEDPNGYKIELIQREDGI